VTSKADVATTIEKMIGNLSFREAAFIYFLEISFPIPGETEVKAQPRGKRNMSSREIRNDSVFPPSMPWSMRTREWRIFFIPSFT
jgi:hypothetical protein